MSVVVSEGVLGFGLYSCLVSGVRMRCERVCSLFFGFVIGFLGARGIRT